MVGKLKSVYEEKCKGKDSKREKVVNKVGKKCALWEIDPRYTLRIVKGEFWSEDICIKCELEKIIGKDDFEIFEVLYVKNTK